MKMKNILDEEQYILLDFSDDILLPTFNRRDFLKTTACGIFIFVFGDVLSLAQQYAARTPTDFNAFLRIGEDGRVTCFTGKIEMGQSIYTSLAQILAEELNVDMNQVDMVMGDTDLCPWDMGTFGSLSIRAFGPSLRAAGAEARAVLLQLAEEQLKVSQDQLVIKKGIVSDSKNPKSKVSYAELTKGKKIAKALQVKPSNEKVTDYDTVGKSIKRTDGIIKVTGKAHYAGDIRVPGMLYAKILRPPAHGAKLISADTSEAEKIKDVQVVKDGDFIAVLHPYPDVAEEALSKIKAQYESSPLKTNDKNIFDHLLATATQGRTQGEAGDLKAGESEGAKVVEETYLNSYVAHAPMEPHTAVAKPDGKRIVIWASTQAPFTLKSSAATALKMAPEDIQVITPFVGGGFGGKSYSQQGIEAARLAKLTGKPVQVNWSREEEFYNDNFRPAAIVKIKSAISSTGKITLWDYNVYFAGSRGSQHFYDIPNHKTVAYGEAWGTSPGSHPFATGPWRAPGNNTNTFARESQIDIMAAKAGVDPLEFRLKHLTDQKMIRVLKATADKFGWKPAKGPSGRGLGIACGIDAGTYVAAIVEITLNKNTGEIQVKRVVSAQDMGLLINPDGARYQMEGCITMGLGYVLAEEIHFENGKIQDTNFNSYQVPRFSWTPKIETVIIENNESPAQGGGEPAIVNMGGAIANAVYDLAGIRLYQLPMTPDRVKEALKTKKG